MNSIRLVGRIGAIRLYFMTGEKSEIFYDAKLLGEDFVAVQVDKNSKWTIINRLNEEVGSFYDVAEFSSGHFKIKTEQDSDYTYLDLVGRISKMPTKSGEDFYSYYKDKISYKDLNKNYFSDPRFLHAIIYEELNKAKYYDPKKYTHRGARAQKLLEISEEVNDWLYQSASVDGLL